MFRHDIHRSGVDENGAHSRKVDRDRTWIIIRGLARIIKNICRVKISKWLQIDLWKVTLICVSNKKGKNIRFAYRITLTISKFVDGIVWISHNWYTENIKQKWYTTDTNSQSPQIVFFPRVDRRRNYRKRSSRWTRVTFRFLFFDNLATRISEAAKREQRWEVKNGRNEICRVVEWKFRL